MTVTVPAFLLSGMRPIGAVNDAVASHPPRPLLAQRLSFVRQGAFVGREAEMRLFRTVLDGDDSYAVLYLHGWDGYGKTAILRQYAAEAERGGRDVVWIHHADGPPPSPSDFGPDAPVIVVDDFEHWRQAEPWLRDRFLPAMPTGTLVVLAGREGPGPAWTCDPGWRDLLRVVEVGELPAAEVEVILDQERVPSQRRSLVHEIAGGHPLSARLAADAVSAGRSDDEVRLEVARTVVRQVAEDVPSAAHRWALEVCAHSDRVTESLLRATIADGDPVALFRWLCDRPYVRCGSHGVSVPDFLRQALRTELAWRDPVRAEGLRERFAGAGVVEQLSRAEFGTAMREALRSWRRLDLLAGNALTRSSMVAAGAGDADPAQELRAALRAAVEAMAEDPRESKGHRALIATYFGTAPTQEAAAERLGLPFSTYRRHLARGLDVLLSLLWRRELGARSASDAG